MTVPRKAGTDGLAAKGGPAGTPRSGSSGPGSSPSGSSRPGLWTRQTKGDRLALGLSYARLGGRPPKRTVWLVALRKQVVDGLRPVTMPAMKNHACFAVVFD